MFLKLPLLYSMGCIRSIEKCGKVGGFAIWGVRKSEHVFCKMLLTLCFQRAIMLT